MKFFVFPVVINAISALQKEKANLIWGGKSEEIDNAAGLDSQFSEEGEEEEKKTAKRNFFFFCQANSYLFVL